jgi:hypothetical protein
MKKINKIIFIIFISYSINSHSQKKYLDYITTEKNDTIFGTLRNDIIGGKVLFEKNPKFKRGGVKYYSRKLKKVKTIRFNDDIYIYKNPSDDGIYENPKENIYNDTLNVIKTLNANFFNIKSRLIDYVVTINNDTIYGVIENPTFGKNYLINKNKVKIKIEKDTIKEYRYLNNVYQYFEKENINVFDSRKAYLKLLLNGKVKLFEYEYHFIQTGQNNVQINQVDYYYYILKDNELILLRNIEYKKKLSDLFSDINHLISKINDDEYTLENIYLIVKYYNEEK